MDNIKKAVSFILITITILATFIAILSVWDIISLEDVMFKIMKTLFIIFVAALVILFIFNILFRQGNSRDDL